MRICAFFQIRFFKRKSCLYSMLEVCNYYYKVHEKNPICIGHRDQRSRRSESCCSPSSENKSESWVLWPNDQHRLDSATLSWDTYLPSFMSSSKRLVIWYIFTNIVKSFRIIPWLISYGKCEEL